MPNHKTVQSLTATGINLDDAITLTKIGKSLHRWFELEQGGKDEKKDWKIERDEEDNPHLAITFFRDGFKSSFRIPDREKGAVRRLTKIMAKYPKFKAFIQKADPSKPTLYVLRPGDLDDLPKGKKIDYAGKGIPVYE